MSYKEQRDRIYTDDGMRLTITTLLKAQQLTETSGVFTAGAVMGSCDTFVFYNCIDWLVENKFLRVVSDKGRGQDMVLAARKF